MPLQWKPTRIITLVGGLLFVFILIRGLGEEGLPSPHLGGSTTEKKGKPFDVDPNMEHWGPPEGIKLYGPGESDRVNATLLSLVRNNELDGMLQAMEDLERTFNHKFNYPWTFINDEPFSDIFKKKTKEKTKAEVIYEIIPREHWDVPGWINEELMTASADLLTQQGVQYSKMQSYHQMCRWNSGMFYKHPALLKYKWYWRVEPKVHFFCDIDYDPFRYMQDANKTYGFVINIYDSPQSIATLWPATLEFMAEHPEHIHPNNAMPWLTESNNRPEHNKNANGYSTCHFWSNFEIGDMDFWRSKKYEDYFAHIDRAGGFFYERWGDAPVHSIALALMEDKEKIHWFRDIGYQHIPYFNCPNSPKCKGCQAGRFTDGTGLDQEDCRAQWFKVAGMG